MVSININNQASEDITKEHYSNSANEKVGIGHTNFYVASLGFAWIAILVGLAVAEAKKNSNK